MSDINQILSDMREAGKIADMKEKGNQGEDAAMAVMHQYYLQRSGLLYHSFKYPYASNRQEVVYLGNIFRQEDGSFSDVTRQLIDEIDILYISPFKIFPIEVKSYHARKIDVFDPWMKTNGALVEKSPIAQAEKHARHLYHQLYAYLPDGDPKYIKPIVCFVDRCVVEDTRSAANRFYLPVCVLNNLKQTIIDADLASEYTLDLEAIEKRLKEIQKTGDLENE